jgi:hypothetical protein
MDQQTPDMHDQDTLEQVPGSDAAPSGRRRRLVVPLWLALVVMGVSLLCAVLILARVAGPLYGLLFPLDPPVPDGVEEVEHVKPDTGAEYWIYRTTLTGRQVAEFYEQEGGQCRYSLQGQSEDERVEDQSYSVARCLGEKESAGLKTSWEVLIAEGYSDDIGPTIFRLYKYGEVN